MDLELINELTNLKQNLKEKFYNITEEAGNEENEYRYFKESQNYLTLSGQEKELHEEIHRLKMRNYSDLCDSIVEQSKLISMIIGYK